MIGKKLSPILREIAETLWEVEANNNHVPMYSNEAIADAAKIFMSVLMDKMWKLQEEENIPQEQREQMAQKAGEELRTLIKIYTNIDTHTFYLNL